MTDQTVGRRNLSRRSVLKLGALGGGAALLAACSPSSSSSPSQSASGPAPTGAPGTSPGSTPAGSPVASTETLTVGFHDGINTLDPYFWSSFRDLDMVTLLFEGLTYRLPSGEFVGQLAESWKRIDDTTWQFNLRKGLTFQDDNPFNADAVKYSFARSIDPALAATLYSSKIMGLIRGDVVDENTVNMVTKGPIAETALQTRMSDFAMLDPMYYQGLSNDDAGAHPSGSGPFALGEWVKDDHLTLTANTTFWRNNEWWGSPAPRIGTLTYKVLPEPTDRMAAVTTGAIDIAWDIPIDVAKSVSSPLTSAIVLTDGRMFMGINQALPFMKDKRVRQALNYAVNWDAINQALFEGKAPRLASWVDPRSVNFDTTLKPYAYDVDKAKSLLQAAGVPASQKLTMLVDSGVGQATSITQAIANDYQAVGLTVELQPIETSVLFGKLGKKDVPELWFTTFGGGSDDGQGALTTIQKDFVLSAYSWDNPDWEHEFASLNGSAAVDLDLRKAAVVKMQQIAVDDPPVVYLCQSPLAHVYGSRVKSWEPRFDQLFMPWEVQLG